MTPAIRSIQLATCVRRGIALGQRGHGASQRAGRYLQRQRRRRVARFADTVASTALNQETLP